VIHLVPIPFAHEGLEIDDTARGFGMTACLVHRQRAAPVLANQHHAFGCTQCVEELVQEAAVLEKAVAVRVVAFEFI
jgi:hypothetical protein